MKKTFLTLLFAGLLSGAAFGQACLECVLATKSCLSWRVYRWAAADETAEELEAVLELCLDEYRACSPQDCDPSALRANAQDLRSTMLDLCEEFQISDRKHWGRRVHRLAMGKPMVRQARSSGTLELAFCDCLEGWQKRECRRMARHNLRWSGL